MSLLCALLLATPLVGVIKQDTAARVLQAEAQPVPQGKLDALVFARLERLGIPPAKLCSDAVFLRRVFLDVIGTLPTAKEAREFLRDTTPDKRSKLVDLLLKRDEFADYWGMKWCDLLRVKAEFPVNLWPNAAQAYHHWIHTSLQANLPYDRFVREMLTSNGSNFRVGQVNFYRAVQSRTPQGIAQAVALNFMGTRTEKWPAEQAAGMAAFFAEITYKTTGEWKEEIVCFDPGRASAAKDGKPVAALFPDGTPAKWETAEDPRKVFADWLITPKNPWFARNIVNRIWAWLLGRGIIHEPDDIRPDNKPANPQLLAYLEKELVAAKFDLKHVFRLILNSQTYQLSSILEKDSPLAASNFAKYPLRRLEAEVLIDAINQITGTEEHYSSPIPEPFTFIPEGARAIALPDGSITSPFLEQFGRPSRDTGLESERSNRPTADQRLHMLNSSHILRKIESGGKLQGLFLSGASKSSKSSKYAKAKTSKSGKYAKPTSTGDAAKQPADVAAELYLTILSRFPTAEELQTVGQFMLKATSKRDAATDVAWALINSPEFLYRH